jgi:predicted SnoaL-like aldol condensation-catalyzing enzyme
MLIKLCVGNYATHDGLFNGANGVVQYVTKLQKNESLVWIRSNNPKARSITIIQNQHLYTTHIHETWTPTQPISKEIQIKENLSH